jgi:hypothetical protein
VESLVSSIANTSLIVGDVWTFRCLADDGFNVSSGLNSGNVTIGPRPIGQVSGISTTATGDEFLIVAWSNPTSPLWLSTAVYRNAILISNTTATSQSFTGLLPATSYLITFETYSSEGYLNDTFTSWSASTTSPGGGGGGGSRPEPVAGADKTGITIIEPAIGYYNVQFCPANRTREPVAFTIENPLSTPTTYTFKVETISCDDVPPLYVEGKSQGQFVLNNCLCPDSKVELKGAVAIFDDRDYGLGVIKRVPITLYGSDAAKLFLNRRVLLSLLGGLVVLIVGVVVLAAAGRGRK